MKRNDFLTKIGEGGGQQHIVKIRSFLFCIIYYWIWPDQFPTNCWKCPLLFYKGFLYAYKVCKNNNDITFSRLPFLCLSVCTLDPQKVTGIIKNARGNVKKKLKVSKPKISWFLSKILGEGGRSTWSTLCQKYICQK